MTLGKNIVCGSEDGRVYIWESLTGKDLPARIKLQKFVSHKKYDRNKYCAKFSACNAIGGYEYSNEYREGIVIKAVKPVLPIVTETIFVPEIIVKEAVINDTLLPSLQTIDQIDYDWSSAMVVTSDYEGTIRVFVQKHCLDVVARASRGFSVS